MTLFYDLCVYTIRHSLKIEEFSRSTQMPHSIDTKRKAWTSAKQLIAAAGEQGMAAPILFAPAEDTSFVIAAGELVEVSIGEENYFRFANLRRLVRPLKKSSLRLRNDATLSPDFIRDYAICRTPSDLANRIAASGLAQPEPDSSDDIEDIFADTTLDPTTRKALIDARLGQGRFRSDVIAQWQDGCAVTKCAVLDVLRASHIKPWRDSSDKERLDPANGLLLCANLDALFDRGLIAFDDGGQMIVSRLISAKERRRLGLPRKLVRTPNASERIYLAHHRRRKFTG